VVTTQEPSYGESEQRLSDDEVVPIEAVSPRSKAAARGQTRVLVVDERPLTLIGASGLLRGAGIDVVGEAPGPEAAVTTAREVHPDVVLMDLKVTGMAGSDAVRLVAREALGARVIVVAAANDSELLGALAAGACGALTEDASAHELVTAIRAAAEGDSVFSPSIASALMRQLRLLGDGHLPQLTARELEVLELVARGWDNARIAEAMYLSVGTVKHHISSILTKLDVENRIQAAVRAVQHGLIRR
jgi:DNA-binding NarL/FixJ family response regulator